MKKFTEIINGIRQINNCPEGFIPLHAPVFKGREREYVLDTIDSTFVSSVGEYVNKFEELLTELSGAEYAIACSNGTAALQVALFLAGVRANDLVLTQSLSFVATANAITHGGAEPAFIDIDEKTLGMSSGALELFFKKNCHLTPQGTIHRASGKKISACVPMHTFGLPCDIEAIAKICQEWNVKLVEDAAEALGSLNNGKHCGTFGELGILSFNGNKIITTGGGGAILTNDTHLAKLGKHLTTTAKLPHQWEFSHDYCAWNFRMPNLNAALGCAQLEQLDKFVAYKRHLALAYQNLFSHSPWGFINEPVGARSNYWLCAIRFNSRQERDEFLKFSNESGVMTRPCWEPLHSLPMYNCCHHGELSVTKSIADTVVNLPSGVRADDV